MKYIETKALYEYLEQVSESYPMYADNIIDNAVSNVIVSIKTFIASHQQEQPEVDSLIRCELPDMVDDKRLGLCYCNQFGNHRMTIKDVREIARHIYEFGLNARKEE